MNQGLSQQAPQSIAVIGAGLMGHGIALTFARHGHNVSIHDPDANAMSTLKQRVSDSFKALGVTPADAAASLARITQCGSISECVSTAAYVFEAAPEKLALKQQIFAEVEAAAPADCILASNTSVILITKIMGQLADKSRALGTHWWNPPHMIPLVEVIRTQWTDDSVMDRVMALLGSVGKQPVRVEKDVPGFIGNRLQHALWREAINLVENGICSAAAVDEVVTSSFGRRLAVLGPLANADLVGTDLTLDIHENVLHDLDNRAAPSPYLAQLVDSNKLGMKNGEGFQHWTKEEAQAMRDKVASHLKKLDTILD